MWMKQVCEEILSSFKETEIEHTEWWMQSKSWIVRSPRSFSRVVHSRHRCAKHCRSWLLKSLHARKIIRPQTCLLTMAWRTFRRFPSYCFVLLIFPLLLFCLTSSQLSHLAERNPEAFPGDTKCRGHQREQKGYEQLPGSLLLHCRRGIPLPLSSIPDILHISNHCQASSNMCMTLWKWQAACIYE